MSDRKEPHFWSRRDLLGICQVDSYDDYLSLFEDTKDNHHAVGEASVFNLYSDIEFFIGAR